MNPAASGAAGAAGANVTAWAENLDPWPGFAPLKEEITTEVCVVGLGGSGLAAITRLLEHGIPCVGIDAGSVAGGAAGRNGGLLLAGLAAFHHEAARSLGREEAVRWYRATQVEVERMLAEVPDSARRTGSLRIALDEAELADCREQFEVMRADGLDATLHEGPEGRGLLFPADAVFNPLDRCRRLARRAAVAGARLHEFTPAVGIAGDRVETPLGAVRCRRVIVAVDGRLADVLPELATVVRPARLQMLATEPTGEITLARPVYARYGYEYWQQLPDGRLLLGGFRDRGGEGEWTRAADPAGAVQEHLERFLRSGLGVKARIAHRWAATVAYSSGVLPVFSEVRPGVLALGGYSGTGNVIGSLLGRRAADIAAGAPADYFPAPTRG